MASTLSSSEGIQDRLSDHEDRKQVTEHPFFRALRDTKLSPEQVEVIVGQYWLPIHYFPNFLSDVIIAVPSLEMKTFVSKILWQELGEGDPAMAHEVLYVETMRDAGLNPDRITNSEPLHATKQLMSGYESAGEDPATAIGFLYGTEVIDLAMVSSLGTAVRNATGIKKLPWVDIHVKQEPDHVASVKSTVSFTCSDAEGDKIVAQAECMWKYWSDFYFNIAEEVGVSVSSGS